MRCKYLRARWITTTRQHLLSWLVLLAAAVGVQTVARMDMEGQDQEQGRMVVVGAVAQA